METPIKVMAEIDEASARVEALCELLAAAAENKVSASCVRSMLQPIARQLGRVAGVVEDRGQAVNRSGA